METGSASVVIDRPIEEVFSFVTRIEDHPRWMSFARQAQVTSEGPVQVGSTYLYNGEFLGRKMETTGEVVEYEVPRRYGWRATSRPFPSEGSWAFEAVDGGTRVTLTMSAEPGGFFSLAASVLMRMGRRIIEADLANLKELLETQPTPIA